MIHYTKDMKKAICGWHENGGYTISSVRRHVTCKRCLKAMGKIETKNPIDSTGNFLETSHGSPKASRKLS